MRESTIRRLQERLRLIAGYGGNMPMLTVDGIYDERTENAVRAFQHLFGLPVTGQMDFDTWARGFIFGVPVAYNLKKSFIPVRKKGKLPCETIERTYDLEYGTATIEMHKDAIRPGQKVVIVDDLIATGGTIEAITKLVEELGGEVVKIVFLMELEGLNGREKLQGYNVDSVIKYPGK